AYATAGFTGLLCWSPYRLPPGLTAEYRFAVDSARPADCPEPLLNDELSRLNAFAVLAFWAEIPRLPGHWAPRLAPENATAHTMPSRLAIAAHMLLLSPLASAAVAVARAPRSAAWLGSPSHASSAAAMVERGKRPPMRDIVKISATRFILVPSLMSWDFRYELRRPRGVERADHPVAQLVHPFQQGEASARPEQPLLEAREGPALDGDRQDQSGRRR